MNWEQLLAECARNNDIQQFQTTLESKVISDRLKNTLEWNHLNGAPIHVAAFAGRYEMLKLLLENGGRVNSYWQVANEIEKSFRVAPLALAIAKEQFTTIKLLMKFGADEKMEIKFISSKLSLILIKTNLIILYFRQQWS